MDYVGPFTKDLIDTCTKEFKKKENKDKIMKNVVDPIVSELFRRYYAYISFFLFIHIITILLLIYIIYIVKR
jgi:hypothetical protein